MSAVKLTNAVLYQDDWSFEVITKDLLKKGHFNIWLDSMTSTTSPVIQAGSSIDIVGVIYNYEANETLFGLTPSQGVNYIMVSDVDGSGILSLSTIAPSWSDEDKGYYIDNSRAIAKFMLIGTEYTEKEMLDEVYRAKEVLEDKILRENNILAEFSMSQIQASQLQLTGTDSTADDWLGATESEIFEDNILSAAYHKSTSTGCVYSWHKHDTKGYSTWTNKAKISSPSPATNEYFGWAMSLSDDGNYLAVGARGYTSSGTANAGCVYVYKKTGTNSWGTGVRILSPASPIVAEGFGSAVRFNSNNELVIGAQFNNSNVGTAYQVFRTGDETWGTPVEITTTDRLANGFFGNSIAIYGKWMVIGAYASSATGKIFIYENVEGTWTQRQTFVSNNTTSWYGQHVAIWGDYIAVAAKADSEFLTTAGAVYIYKVTDDTWALHQKMIASDAQASQTWSEGGVKLYKNWLLVGQQDEDTTAANSGAVYLYRLDGGYYQHQTKIKLASPVASDDFGTGIAMSDKHIVVGCQGNDTAGSAAGCIYVYKFLGGI